MAATLDEVRVQLDAFAAALTKLTAKERSMHPSAHYGIHLNSLAAIAKELLPDVDERLWPPTLDLSQVKMGPQRTLATYVEIKTYVEELKNIIQANSPFSSGFFRG
jgi:hypothetical protein